MSDATQSAKIWQQVIALNTRLVEACDAYYKRNQPIMSNAEFDALERRLKDLIHHFPSLTILATVLHTVGTDINDGKRIPHNQPMRSIENKYEEKDLIDWHAALPVGTDVCLEPKFDGVSISIIYQNHNLIRALTRGDGDGGEEITLQVAAVDSIPKILPPSLPGDLEVRGELVMKNSTLERINLEAATTGGKVYTSTRNLTGGTMKLHDLNLIPDRQIQIMPWDVLGDDNVLPDSGIERLRLIVQAGFPAPLGVVVSNGVAVGVTLKQKLLERQTILRDQLSLETDGVVIKVDSHKLRRRLGVGSKYTNYQTCFKPQSASGTTYLREIEWQVGRTGKVSPVAVCDPVVLAGAKIEHASLNNISWIREKGLKLGAKVEMLRSGDVIPQIVKVIDEGESEIVPPSHCPECSTLLVESDEGGAGTLTHRCPNKNCRGRVIGTLAFIGRRDVLEIDGLGPEMAKRLVVGNYAHDLRTLYEFQVNCSVSIANRGEEGFIALARKKGFDVTVLKMVKSLERAKTAPWDRWIKALGIDMIGDTLGTALALNLDLQSEDMKELSDKLLYFVNGDSIGPIKVDGFGPAKIQAIHEWVVSDKHSYGQSLYNSGVRPTPLVKPKVINGAPLKGVSFCITGTFGAFGEREQIEKHLISLGAAAKTGVSKKTNLLLVGLEPGKSKVSKAVELGIKQEGEDWLRKVYQDNNLSIFNSFEA